MPWMISSVSVFTFSGRLMEITATASRSTYRTTGSVTLRILPLARRLRQATPSSGAREDLVEAVQLAPDRQTRLLGTDAERCRVAVDGAAEIHVGPTDGDRAVRTGSC